jgi:glycogen synthase
LKISNPPARFYIQNNFMHITFLDFDDISNPLLGAGQAITTLEVGKELIKLGHKVTVISARYPKSKDRIENEIHFEHIGIGTKFLRINNLIYNLALVFALKNVKADIIVECFTTPYSTLFSPLFTKIPVIGLPAFFDADRLSKKYHLPLFLIENFGVKFYKYFLAYTKYYEDKMKKLNPKIISKTISEGVSNEYFQIKKQASKHILFLGRFDMNQKGIDLLLLAYKQIEKNTKYPLIIVGKGNDQEKIQELINSLNLNRKVFIKNAAYGKEKEKLLSESICIILPSRSETFSCFALEAMAADTPLVTFDIPGLEWIPNSIAVKAKPFDEKSLAEKILFLCQNETQNKAIGKRSKQFAKNFTWGKMAKEYDSFFQEVIIHERRKNEK